MAEQSASKDEAKTPFTIITGFLGAGKTTLINYILTEQRDKRICVIENEFGEINIDEKLVSANMASKEDLIQMDNGCACCSIRGDLVRTLGGLVEKRQQFDAVMLETTGLADPAPIIATLKSNQWIDDNFAIDAVVCLASAKHVKAHLEEQKPDGAGAASLLGVAATASTRSPRRNSLAAMAGGAALLLAHAELALRPRAAESSSPGSSAGHRWRGGGRATPARHRRVTPLGGLVRESAATAATAHKTKNAGAVNEAVQQVAFSDKILLNKVDLVTPDELTAIRKDIRKINHFAEVIECERSKVDLKKIIGINSFDIEKCIDLDPVLFKKTEGSEEPASSKVHDLSMVSSCGISVEGFLDVPKFNIFMAELLQTRAADLYRSKGVLSFAGQGDQKFVFQGVHEQIDFGPAQTQWQKGERRVSKIVFIGRNLDRKFLTEKIESCLVPGATE